MLVKTIHILSRGLPKSGQTISYATGDDGAIEAGWWRGRESVYGNRKRFVTTTYTVYDRATGLMWVRDGTSAGGNLGEILEWSDALVFANNLVFQGFSDWRLPNISEFLSIWNAGAYNPAVYSEFINWGDYKSSSCWSSTTDKSYTFNAWLFEPHANIPLYVEDKEVEYRVRAVRGGI